MAGLVPAIDVLPSCAKTWMPGTRPGMTSPIYRSAFQSDCQGISYTTILSAMPRSAASFWIGLIACF
jgi:hypothetical protein